MTDRSTEELIARLLRVSNDDLQAMHNRGDSFSLEVLNGVLERTLNGLPEARGGSDTRWFAKRLKTLSNMIARGVAAERKRLRDADTAGVNLAQDAVHMLLHQIETGTPFGKVVQEVLRKRLVTAGVIKDPKDSIAFARNRLNTVYSVKEYELRVDDQVITMIGYTAGLAMPKQDPREHAPVLERLFVNPNAGDLFVEGWNVAARNPQHAKQELVEWMEPTISHSTVESLLYDEGRRVSRPIDTATAQQDPSTIQNRAGAPVSPSRPPESPIPAKPIHVIDWNKQQTDDALREELRAIGRALAGETHRAGPHADGIVLGSNDLVWEVTNGRESIPRLRGHIERFGTALGAYAQRNGLPQPKRDDIKQWVHTIAGLDAWEWSDLSDIEKFSDAFDSGKMGRPDPSSPRRPAGQNQGWRSSAPAGRPLPAERGPVAPSELIEMHTKPDRPGGPDLLEVVLGNPPSDPSAQRVERSVRVEIRDFFQRVSSENLTLFITNGPGGRMIVRSDGPIELEPRHGEELGRLLAKVQYARLAIGPEESKWDLGAMDSIFAHPEHISRGFHLGVTELQAKKAQLHGLLPDGPGASLSDQL